MRSCPSGGLLRAATRLRTSPPRRHHDHAARWGASQPLGRVRCLFGSQFPVPSSQQGALPVVCAVIVCLPSACGPTEASERTVGGGAVLATGRTGRADNQRAICHVTSPTTDSHCAREGSCTAGPAVSG